MDVAAAASWLANLLVGQVPVLASWLAAQSRHSEPKSWSPKGPSRILENLESRGIL